MDLLAFWSLFQVALMPILEVLLISAVGAVMATEYFNLLTADTRRSLNKIVFTIFTPSITFASLAQTVTFHDIVSWWFMPVNVALTFLFGALLGEGVTRMLKPPLYIKGLVKAASSAGNLGNLVLILIPAICRQDASPFGDHGACVSIGLSYTSFSMALGGLFMWTYIYQMLGHASAEHRKLQAEEEAAQRREPNRDPSSLPETKFLLSGNRDVESSIPAAAEQQTQLLESSETLGNPGYNCHDKLVGVLKELKAPPTIGAILGLFFGTVPWLKSLIIGDHATFHVIQDSIQLLGEGTIPCITLILGGNLAEGLRSKTLRPVFITAVIVIKYLLLPVIGLGVVKLADYLGFLPADPLYHFVLMIQFTLPPAMNIGTMTQLFDVGQEECSVLFLWSYLVAAFALTFWATIYMWILS